MKKIYMILLILVIFCFIFYIRKTYEATKQTTNAPENEEWISVSDVDISNVTQNIMGYLSIPKFNDKYYINMPIKEGTELKILATSIGHFRKTPYENGNVCLVAHNSGTNKNGQYVGYFDRIKELSKGDIVIYDNLENNYAYEVISNNIISESNIEVLEDFNDNRLTLITCVKGEENREYRQCVTCLKLSK